jgi:pyruvate dehydrogenase (quinone)
MKQMAVTAARSTATSSRRLVGFDIEKSRDPTRSETLIPTLAALIRSVPMSSTVAELLVETLAEIGVRQVFGIVGDALNPFTDAIRRQNRIEWVGVRHEEGAALAAAGQAKLTGHMGVCCGTTGPGGTDLVPGLYEARKDHAPVLAISGGVESHLRGTDYLQDNNPDLLFRDVAIYTQTIGAAEQAPAVFHQAIAEAYGARGVAHICIPPDVFAATLRAGCPVSQHCARDLRSRPRLRTFPGQSR